MTNRLDSTRRTPPVIPIHPPRPPAVEFESLLTPAEVAKLFRVDPKTVTRWADQGRLTSVRTLGGHRRFREAEVRALYAAGGRRD